MRSRKRRSAGASAASVPAAGSHVLPLTVSREALLDGGSDRRFRSLVADLLTISARMEVVRDHLGRKLGITGPQYSLVVAIAHLQGGIGISVGSVAHALHVSSAFVASETGKLVRRGFLLKRTNPADRRGVLLSIAPSGRLKLDRASSESRAINDCFFAKLDSRTFRSLSAAATMLVEGSGDAVRALNYRAATVQEEQRAVG